MSPRAGTKKRQNDRDPGTFIIREVENADLEALFRLSKFLNSVNLPHDIDVLRQQIQRSRKSFSGRIEDPFERQYMFVMEHLSSGELAGTSTVFAQHGDRDAPHVFFDVVEDQRYSVTLDRHFSHVTLRLGFDYQGPTEIGALVIGPKFRALGLGRPLSFVRFMFIAMYPDLFRPSVIAELMPPLEKDGRSLLWEHVGKHFTGLTYQEADRLSKTNKEFIISLFPQTPIQASLLPERVRRLIGQVGSETRGVKRMLEDIGFHYSQRIDPFDGGPHFIAATDRISLIRATRVLKLSDDELPALPPSHAEFPTSEYGPYLLAVYRHHHRRRFLALVDRAEISGDEVRLTGPTRTALKLRRGDAVHTMPIRPAAVRETR
ncbi:MAG: arginine N-succinyltransferase [Deltaproteobacteria bacterium]|nr:arginine N-succinyltransferase [Deltaproteobacteria bacterium]